jgi:hypothetical protein
MINIKGFCPQGCGETLFVGNGGYISCSYVNCPDPSYVSDLLDDRETEHIVRFTDKGFTVQHPLKERREKLMDCDLHVRLAELDGAPLEKGTYRFIAHNTGKPWSFQRLNPELLTKEPN